MLQNQEKIEKLLQNLRNMAPDNDLNRLEDSSQTEANLHELASEIVAPVKRDGVELDVVLAELSDQCPAMDFWEDMRQRAVDYLLPYQETAFLREMEEDVQNEYLMSTFEGLIRYREPSPYLCKTLNVTREQLDSTTKTYNTLIDWVVTQRMSKRLFALSSEDFFGMSDSLISFFWKLINDNRSMLVERTILGNLERTSQFVEQTTRLIDSIGNLMIESSSEGDSDEDSSID